MRRVQNSAARGISEPGQVGSVKVMADDTREHRPRRSEPWVGTGAGAIIGVTIGILMDNLPIGIAIGIAIGSAIGAASGRFNTRR